MLMRPHMVVPASEFSRSHLQFFDVRDRNSIHALLQRTEEPFDSPVCRRMCRTANTPNPASTYGFHAETPHQMARMKRLPYRVFREACR
jgi:hypothetical protein